MNRPHESYVGLKIFLPLLHFCKLLLIQVGIKILRTRPRITLNASTYVTPEKLVKNVIISPQTVTACWTIANTHLPRNEDISSHTFNYALLKAVPINAYIPYMYDIRTAPVILNQALLVK